MMLNSEITDAYCQRKILNSSDERRRKNSEEFQPKIMQQNLQFFNNKRMKVLKTMQSKVVNRSTVTGYSSVDLLKNTDQYRIASDQYLREVTRMITPEDQPNQRSNVFLIPGYTSSNKYGILPFRWPKLPSSTIACQTGYSQTASICQTSSSTQTPSNITDVAACKTASEMTTTASQTHHEESKDASCQTEQPSLLVELQELIRKISQSTNYGIDIVITDRKSDIKTLINTDQFLEDHLDGVTVPLASKSLTEYSNKATQVKGIKSTETQTPVYQVFDTSTKTLSSQFFGAANQKLSSNSFDKVIQESYNGTPTTILTNMTAASNQTTPSPSPTNSNKPFVSDVNDASGTRSEAFGIQALSATGTSAAQNSVNDQEDDLHKSRFSVNDFFTNLQKLTEAFITMNESLQKSIDKLTQDIDRYTNSTSESAYQSSPENSSLSGSDQSFKDPLDLSVTSSYRYSTQSDISPYQTPTSSYGYSTQSTHTSPYHTLTNSYGYNNQDSSSHRPASRSNGYRTQDTTPYRSHITSYEHDESDTDYFSFSPSNVSDTSSYEFYYSFEHDKSDTEHLSFSSCRSATSSYEQYHPVQHDRSDAVEDGEHDRSDTDYSPFRSCDMPATGSSDHYHSVQNYNSATEHLFFSSCLSATSSYDRSVQYDTFVSDHDYSPDEGSSSYKQDVSSSDHGPCLAEKETVQKPILPVTRPKTDFDIHRLVTVNNAGHFSLDHSTMMTMFGFDPRKSPFGACGYKSIHNLPEDLDDIELEDVEQQDIIYERNEDKSRYEIGRGTYGVVYLARMKNIEKNVVIKSFHHGGVSWEDVEEEARILKYLKNKNITPNFLGILTSGKNPRAYSIVQEFYGHGTVHDITKNYRLLPDVWIVICKNICQILYQIHSHHIIFNDLKSDNILVDLNNFDIRFIDFGMATFRKGIVFEGKPGNLAECLYLAPEVREGCSSTPQSDIYSLGYLFQRIIGNANVSQLIPLHKSCTRIQASKRPSLLEVINTLNTL